MWWSVEKYSFGKVSQRQIDVDADEAPNPGGEGSANDSRADAKSLLALDFALTSRLFWAYRSMIDFLFLVITHMMIWVEGCPCHTHSAHLHGNTKYHRRREFMSSFDGVASCPLRTRRAPEMGAGVFHQVLAELFAVRTATIMTSVLPTLSSESDRQLVLRDWESGRRTFVYIMSVKLSAWQRLPLMLCGAAHHDENVARSVLARGYEMYEEPL
jgi:hypothetical protein